MIMKLSKPIRRFKRSSLNQFYNFVKNKLKIQFKASRTCSTDFRISIVDWDSFKLDI